MPSFPFIFLFLLFSSCFVPSLAFLLCLFCNVAIGYGAVSSILEDGGPIGNSDFDRHNLIYLTTSNPTITNRVGLILSIDMKLLFVNKH